MLGDCLCKCPPVEIRSPPNGVDCGDVADDDVHSSWYLMVDFVVTDFVTVGYVAYVVAVDFVIRRCHYSRDVANGRHHQPIAAVYTHIASTNYHVDRVNAINTRQKAKQIKFLVHVLLPPCDNSSKNAIKKFTWKM